MRTAVLALAAILITTACRPAPKPESKPLIGWRPAGTWSGRGDSQTDSFNIESGQFRIKWEAANETAPGKGTLKLTVHSAVSGRFLALALDHKGAGKDVSYIYDDPRIYYLEIESHDVDWTLKVEELVVGPPEP